MYESITGAALCENIQQTLIILKLNLQNSVSLTHDGAANFSGQMESCASLFQKTVPHAQYFHCHIHDLNPALCHTCHGIPEVRNMLTCVIEIGLFEYSPKRAQLLESVIIAEDMKGEPSKKMDTTKIKLFCETRWIQRQVVLEEIHMLYKPLLKTLEKITTDRGWDNKATDSTHSFMKCLADPTFVVVLNVCSYVLCLTKPLSIMLQATVMDVITAYQNIRLVKEQSKTL